MLVDGLTARGRWWKRHSYAFVFIEVIRVLRGAIVGVGTTNVTKLSRQAQIMEARRVADEGTGLIDTRIETFGMVVVLLSPSRDHVW